MASKKKKGKKNRKGPTAKAKRAYNALVLKGFMRTRHALLKHDRATVKRVEQNNPA